MQTVTVIGGGLAGSEAAWQLARQGVAVRLYEMRPVRPTDAHHTDKLAELVCSNSFRSAALVAAVGLLKEEMRGLGSLVMAAADAARVPAGQALAVDRHVFAQSITDALAARKLPTDGVEPPINVPSGSRRRADFTAIRRRNDLILGFNARSSHRVIDIEVCPVLLPEIVALLAPLRALLTDLMSTAERAEIVVNATRTGLDVLLVTGARLGATGHEALARFADDQDLARLSRRHPQAKAAETIVERRAPMVPFGDVPVLPPPGAFLQATAEGEASLVAAAIAGVGEPNRVLDLYCGCGTFSLPLATLANREPAAVHAIDGGADAVAALDAAARKANLPRVTCETRDLERRPVRVEELNRYDAVVFDPPRAGAKRQAEAIAASNVRHVVAISCNPGTFARDAAILVAGGYRLTLVRPVDQFPWTPHLELAAHFSREPAAR